jgi:SulP family sulfate permease
VRVRKFGPGTIFGELAAYLGQCRTATVVAESECVTYRIAADAVEGITVGDLETRALYHEMMARLMANRIVQMDRVLARH